MQKINTYGINVNIEALIEAAKETQSYPGMREAHDTVFFDISTGDVWTRWHQDFNSWTQYHDDDVISCGSTNRHVSAQTMMDMVRDAYQQEMFFREKCQK